MKIVIIGAGGIGSFLLKEITECIEQEQIDAFTEISISDNDIVELSQIRYQNFDVAVVGKNKASALSKKYSEYGVRPIQKRIEKESQLKEFDFFLLCVDNERTRDLVIRYCHKYDKQFIDLRATGRRIFAMPKERIISQNMKFVDINDSAEYSCQEQSDLDQGLLQKGNKIVAMIGCQMLLNFLRGHNNRIFSMVV